MDLIPLSKKHEPAIKNWLLEFYQNHLAWWSNSLQLQWSDIDIKNHIEKHDLFAKAWRRLLSQSSKNDHFVRAAELNNQLLGVVHAGTEIDKNTGLEIGEILWIHVKEDKRREGTGQLLLDAAHEWLKAQNISGITLFVNQHNDSARKLYQKSRYIISDLRMMHPL